MEHRIEEFFWEIKRKQSWSPRKAKDLSSNFSKRQRERELKKLHSGINYKGKDRGRNKRKGCKGLNHSEYLNEDTNMYLEY